MPVLARDDLDALAAHHLLDEAGVRVLLEVSGARPGPVQTRDFAVRVLRVGGVLSLLCAVIFFVAANWDELGRFSRFGLVVALLLGVVGVSLARPPPAQAGRLGLFAAFVLTGVLLALFGQTYQTGADVHELFFGWCLLGLPFAVAGQWAATWAAWALVLNTALGLLAGWLPVGHVFWSAFERWGFSSPFLFAVTLLVDLGLAFASEALASTPARDAAAPWLARLLTSCGFLFGSFGFFSVLFDFGRGPHGSGGGLLTLALGAAMVGVTWRAMRQRRDVFPVAVVAASVIACVLALIIKEVHGGEEVFLTSACWLVGSSTVAAVGLVRWSRRWKPEGTLR